jgi:DNA mismatch endonuclease, patch repair protein
MDVVDVATRSRMMSAVRSRNTAPEMRVRRFLHACGFRYRLHVRALPGCPDIVLPKFRTAIFVHGCFWHQHSGCAKARLPTSNSAFWADKLARNVARDRAAIYSLEQDGWRVLVVWECETRQQEQLHDLASTIRDVDFG